MRRGPWGQSQRQAWPQCHLGQPPCTAVEAWPPSPPALSAPLPVSLGHAAGQRAHLSSSLSQGAPMPRDCSALPLCTLKPYSALPTAGRLSQEGNQGPESKPDPVTQELAAKPEMATHALGPGGRIFPSPFAASQKAIVKGAPLQVVGPPRTQTNNLLRRNRQRGGKHVPEPWA